MAFAQEQAVPRGTKPVRPSVLALDPGYTTGWAFLPGSVHGTQQTVITGNLDIWQNQGDRVTKDLEYAVGLLVDSIRDLRDRFHAHAVVIERLPNTLTQVMQEIVSACRAAAPLAFYVSPGEWKPVTNRLPVPEKRGKTQHEKDAYRIAVYWLFKNGHIPSLNV
jgi:hypothetical protein